MRVPTRPQFQLFAKESCANGIPKPWAVRWIRFVLTSLLIPSWSFAVDGIFLSTPILTQGSLATYNQPAGLASLSKGWKLSGSASTVNALFFQSQDTTLRIQDPPITLQNAYVATGNTDDAGAFVFAVESNQFEILGATNSVAPTQTLSSRFKALVQTSTVVLAAGAKWSHSLRYGMSLSLAQSSTNSRSESVSDYGATKSFGVSEVEFKVNQVSAGFGVQGDTEFGSWGLALQTPAGVVSQVSKFRQQVLTSPSGQIQDFETPFSAPNPQIWRLGAGMVWEWGDRFFHFVDEYQSNGKHRPILGFEQRWSRSSLSSSYAYSKFDGTSETVFAIGYSSNENNLRWSLGPRVLASKSDNAASINAIEVKMVYATEINF